MILSGKEAAEALLRRTAQRAAVLKAEGVTPALALLWSAEDPAAESYRAGIRSRAAAAGVSLREHCLPAGTDREAALSLLNELNQAPSVHGILLCLPLPEALAGVESAIAPEKDVDGVTPASAAAVYLGREDGFAPCTAEACLRLLEHYGIDPAGKTAAVVGRSPVIGRPAALMLTARNATVTLCHSKTPDLTAAVKGAELVLSCTGQPGLLDERHIRQGAVVLDVGVAPDPATGRICGDVCFHRVKERCAAISPVPGGVGPVTSAVLMEHTVRAAEQRRAASVK